MQDRQVETPAHHVWTRIQLTHIPCMHLQTHRCCPSAGSRQPRMGLRPTINIHIQDFSGYFPHFLPGLTLNPKWTPTSLKGHTCHSSNIHAANMTQWGRPEALGGPRNGRLDSPCQGMTCCLPSRLTVGTGEILKEWDLGRRSDRHMGKGPWWLPSPASSRSLCAHV